MFNGEELYRPPTREVISYPKRGTGEKGDSQVDPKEAKPILYIDLFWDRLQKRRPKYCVDAEGFRIAHGALKDVRPLADPLEEYRRLMHCMGRQILSWQYENVAMHNETVLRADWTYHVVQLSTDWYAAAMHRFLLHSTSRILRAGNLLGFPTEVDELHHQPHRGITERNPEYF